MVELLGQFKPEEMAVEELFFSKNITTGIAVAHGRGVILLEAERAGIPAFEYTPMQVKQARSASMRPKPMVATPGSMPMIRMETLLYLIVFHSIISDAKKQEAMPRAQGTGSISGV